MPVEIDAIALRPLRTGAPLPSNAATNATPERYEALDALRGLAAVAVILYHAFLFHCHAILHSIIDAWPSKRLSYRLMWYNPLQFLWDGDAAVILFFVLSGFVLSLPYYAGRGPRLDVYLIRRICRIYLPYIVAVMVGLALRSVLYHGNVDGYPDDLRHLWSEPITLKSIVDHCLLVSSSDQRIDPVTWSLTYEMRFSLAFPLLMFVIMRLGTIPTMFLSLLIGCLGVNANEKMVDPGSYLADWLLTLSALVPFTLGALAAKHRRICSTLASDECKRSRVVVGLAGVLLYSYHWLPDVILLRMYNYDHRLIDTAVLSLATGLIIVWILASPGATVFLKRPLLQFLGRVSHSLYLYHMLVLLALMHYWKTSLSPWVILSLTFALSFPVAALAYEWVEKPSIALGRRLTGSQKRTRTAAD